MASFYDNNGKIVFAATVSPTTLEELLEIYSTYNYVADTYEPDSYYIEDGKAILKGIAPSILHEFNYLTKTWELPESELENAKVSYKKLINSKAGIIILQKYPDYTQRNILASGDSTLIETTWSWINSVRDLSNIKTAEIDSASTTLAIVTIFDEFIANLANM